MRWTLTCHGHWLCRLLCSQGCTDTGCVVCCVHRAARTLAVSSAVCTGLGEVIFKRSLWDNLMETGVKSSLLGHSYSVKELTPAGFKSTRSTGFHQDLNPTTHSFSNSPCQRPWALETAFPTPRPGALEKQGQGHCQALSSSRENSVSYFPSP